MAKFRHIDSAQITGLIKVHPSLEVKTLIFQKMTRIIRTIIRARSVYRQENFDLDVRITAGTSCQ